MFNFEDEFEDSDSTRSSNECSPTNTPSKRNGRMSLSKSPLARSPPSRSYRAVPKEEHNGNVNGNGLNGNGNGGRALSPFTYDDEESRQSLPVRDQMAANGTSKPCNCNPLAYFRLSSICRVCTDRGENARAAEEPAQLVFLQSHPRDFSNREGVRKIRRGGPPTTGLYAEEGRV